MSTKEKQNIIYRTNVGDNAYVMISTGAKKSKRFHVMRKPKSGKLKPVFSGSDFGEACQKLFLDGQASLPGKPVQPKLKPQTLIQIF